MTYLIEIVLSYMIRRFIDYHSECTFRAQFSVYPTYLKPKFAHEVHMPVS